MSGVKEKYTAYAIHCTKLNQYKRANSRAASDELTVISFGFFLVVNLLIS